MFKDVWRCSKNCFGRDAKLTTPTSEECLPEMLCKSRTRATINFACVFVNSDACTRFGSVEFAICLAMWIPCGFHVIPWSAVRFEETVNDDSHGAFNLVAGFGSRGGCYDPAAVTCNACAPPSYCTSTTLADAEASHLMVEEPCQDIVKTCQNMKF